MAIVSIKTIHKNAIEDFDLIKELGSGALGSAYLAEHDTNQCVIKKISIKTNPITQKRQLQYLLREVEFLKKTNLLLGYRWDKNTNTFYIAMQFLEGAEEAEYAYSDTYPEILQKTFNALRALHRKGIVHNDPHKSNFIYNETTKTATAIDLGFSSEYNFFQEITDFLIFFYFRENNIADSKRKVFVSLYTNEFILYIQKNKFEAGITFIKYLLITVAILGGPSTFGIVSIFAQELMWVNVYESLFKSLQGLENLLKSDIFKDHFQNINNNPIHKKMTILIKSIEIFSFIYLSLDVFHKIYNIKNFYNNASHIYQTISPKTQDFWIILVQKTDPKDITETLLSYYSFSLAYAFLTRKIREYAPIAVSEKITEWNVYGTSALTFAFRRKEHKNVVEKPFVQKKNTI